MICCNYIRIPTCRIYTYALMLLDRQRELEGFARQMDLPINPTSYPESSIYLTNGRENGVSEQLIL